MQVDPRGFAVHPTLAFTHFQGLKLKYDELVSSFAFKCDLRHYTVAPSMSLLNSVLAVSHGKTQGELVSSNVAGFIYVTAGQAPPLTPVHLTSRLS